MTVDMDGISMSARLMSVFVAVYCQLQIITVSYSLIFVSCNGSEVAACHFCDSSANLIPIGCASS